jgi:hypothetical protein
MNYAGLVGVIEMDKEHLGGNVKIGDPFTYCPSVWNYVIDRFMLDSVMDLGSGCGNAAAYFHRKGMKVVAVEGLETNINSSLFPAVKHDLTIGPVCTHVDLVHCHEVVEHIEETFLDNLLSSLLCGKLILMTHALPGQFGHHHVNLQPPEYWIEKLKARDAILLMEDTARIRALAEKDGAPYMAKSGMIFMNRRRYPLNPTAAD